MLIKRSNKTYQICKLASYFYYSNFILFIFYKFEMYLKTFTANQTFFYDYL